MVYVRVDDQNLLANKILLEFWKAQKKNQAHLLKLNKPERFLLDYLSTHNSISYTHFYKHANISRFKAERILVSLLCMKIIKIHITEKQVYYTLSENPDLKESKSLE